MKVLFISTTDDLGAGTSLFRLAEAFLNLGHEVNLLVQQKSKDEKWVIQYYDRRNLFQKAYYKLKFFFTKDFETEKRFLFFNKKEKLNYIPPRRILNQLDFVPDLIIVGWISRFLNTKSIADLAVKINARSFLLMTDMANITGGCHYAWECLGYTMSCKNCPAILETSFKNQAHLNWIEKRKNIKRGNLQILAGSNWTQKQAALSSLFKQQPHILTFNGYIDQNIFNSKSRNIAKAAFGLNSDRKVIFTGATFTSEKRKGIGIFIESLNLLWTTLPEGVRKQVTVLIAGYNLESNELVKSIQFDCHLIPFIKDERLLSLAYQSSDVFVCTSIEDSGPMMILEALACGTPTIGFNLGHASSIVKDGINGARVLDISPESLSKAIFNLLICSEQTFTLLSKNAEATISAVAGIEHIRQLLNQIKH